MQLGAVLNILFIGDIFGSAGRRIVREHIGHVRESHQVDLTIVNVENAAGGFGVTPGLAEEVFDLGADVLTTGNHVWDKKELVDYMNTAAPYTHDRARRIIRPANFPPGTPGYGFYEGKTAGGVDYAVLQLQGRVFMTPIDDPFRTADSLLAAIRAKVIVVDFHAEATSEKQALGWYLDGRATAVLGTHTHVPTADEKVLLQGTAYISDLGMTGPYESVIGMEREAVIQKFVDQLPTRFEVANGDVRLSAALLDVDPKTGR